MSSRMDLPQSEAICIQQAIATGGDFLDDTELVLDDFQTQPAWRAYEVIQKMRSASLPIEVMTVGMEDPVIERWLWENTSLPLHAAEYHASLLHEAGMRRRLVAVAQSIQQSAPTMDVGDLIDTARKGVDEAAGLRKVGLRFAGDMLDQTLAEIEQDRVAYQSPWWRLDDVLGGGLRPGALYVLGARPGVGKSAIALQLASSLAGYGFVSFSSLEMPASELMRRIVSQGAEISHHLLERGEALPEYAQAKVDMWRERAPVTIAFDDRSGVTVSDIRAHARSVSRHGKLSGIVVDYLQLVSGASGASRLEIVSEVSRQLKITAMELDCPVIALSQLNRNPEARIDKRPALSDLRDSGAIEQDADVVMLLYRDPTFEQTDPPLPVPLELNTVKNRHGAPGVVTLNWEGSQMRAF